jgi:hypothetical protein
MNNIIDKLLPGRPAFERHELVIGHEHLEFYSRDVIQSIRSLYGDPSFAQELAFVPERHYTSHERTCRIYNEMNTGDWWWSVQVRGLNEVRDCLLISRPSGKSRGATTRFYGHTLNHLL